MRKIVLLGVVSTLLLIANEGEEIFKLKCASCHSGYISIEKLTKNFMESENKLLNLKAPTLNQLSFRLKQQIGDPKGDEDMHRMEVGAFIADYLINPDKQKSVCMKDVIKHFDTMPSMKGQIDEEEMEAVSEYIYDYDKNLIEAKKVKNEKFSVALERAKKENKIIMIKATSEHCHYCKKMDREVLIDDTVVEAINKDFISVVVDVSKEQMPLGIDASMTPSFFFVDKSAQVIKTIPGSWNKMDFLVILQEAQEANKNQLKRKDGE